MSLANDLKNEITNLTYKLVDKGFVSNQNMPVLITKGKEKLISWSNQQPISPALKKNINYKDVYDKILEDKNYNFLLTDGAIIQILYKFDNKDKLLSHRLAYFPYPDFGDMLEESDQDTEKSSELIIPVRFDFTQESIDISHPSSHLHFADYESCRMPVSAPITPNVFIDFILRNFYSESFYKNFTTSDLKFSFPFTKSISSNESKILHINIDN